MRKNLSKADASVRGDVEEGRGGAEDGDEEEGLDQAGGDHGVASEVEGLEAKEQGNKQGGRQKRKKHRKR